MKIAHISDLHFGRKNFSKNLVDLRNSLLEFQKNEGLDLVIVTGDNTDGGMNSQFTHYLNIIKDPLTNGTSHVIHTPGNHDRLGDNCAKNMGEKRVTGDIFNDVKVIKIDTTGKHNKWLLFGHGLVCHSVINEVQKEIKDTPADCAIILMMHHHPIPLPEESFPEKISKFFGWPFSSELHLGQDLIEAVKDKVDVILHGHRHIPMEVILPGHKPLAIFNAGCTPRLKRWRVFEFENGRLKDQRWVSF